MRILPQKREYAYNIVPFRLASESKKGVVAVQRTTLGLGGGAVTFRNPSSSSDSDSDTRLPPQGAAAAGALHATDDNSDSGSDIESLPASPPAGLPIVFPLDRRPHPVATLPEPEPDSDDEPAVMPARPPKPASNILYEEQYRRFLELYNRYLAQRVQLHPHHQSIDPHHSTHGIFHRVSDMPYITIRGKKRQLAGYFKPYRSVDADCMHNRDRKLSTWRQRFSGGITWTVDRATRIVRAYPKTIGSVNAALIVLISVILLESKPWLPAIRREAFQTANATWDEQGKESVLDHTIFGVKIADIPLQFILVIASIGWLYMSSMLVYLWQKRPTMQHGEPEPVYDDRSPDKARQLLAKKIIRLDDYFLRYVLREPSHEYFLYGKPFKLPKLSDDEFEQHYSQTLLDARQRSFEFEDLRLRPIIDAYTEEHPLMDPIQVLRSHLWSNVNFAQQSAQEVAQAAAQALSHFIHAIEQLPQQDEVAADAIRIVYGYFVENEQPIGLEAMPQLIAKLHAFASDSFDDDSVYLYDAAKNVALALANILTVVESEEIEEIPKIEVEAVPEGGMIAALSGAGARVFAALGALMSTAETVPVDEEAGHSDARGLSQHGLFSTDSAAAAAAGPGPATERTSLLRQSQ